jgi:ABC-2 type transport system ATP-binding protein
MGSVLEVDGISQRFGDRKVLDGIDLAVPGGRVIGLLGPNGAGKTTLLRIIFGVLEADSGTVSWRGRAATDEDRRSWGYMPQERGVYRDMRTLDLLVFIARLHGIGKARARERALHLLEQLGLGDRATTKVQELSGGMAQRVQLAAAMVHEPELLVLDEPFAGLDPVAVRFLSDVIEAHVRAGRNLLFSSHQLDVVEELCESITLIHQGRVVLQGDLKTLKAASPERYLRVDVSVDPSWVPAEVAEVTARATGGSHLRLRPGADAGAVLDRIREQVPVRSFGVEEPSLSELFLSAAGATRAVLDADARTEVRT